jgi:hypothetical protein
MRSVLIAVLLSAGAYSQTIVDPQQLHGVWSHLETQEDDRPLRCEVTPLHPALNFGFRFQAGYVVRVPLSQYFGPGHSWGILVRIAPDGGDRRPVYLATRLRLPNVPKSKADAEVGGIYLLGEGHYSVQWMLADEAGRVCRKEWTIDARLAHGEHRVKLALEPGTVAELSLRGAPAAHGPDDATPLRLTILMHAAPLFPRRTRMRVGDEMMLLGTLSALLERVPTRSVRLVVFNLDQQKVLFQRDSFTPDALYQVAAVMDGMELGKVDYEVLQNRGGPVELLAGLINQELRAETRSDAVVFLGPMGRYTDKLPPESVETATFPPPRFLYFEYEPFYRATATYPDSIGRAVSKLKGKTVIIRSPADFAKAIDQLEHP